MPRTDERPLAEINIQQPGKITPIDEIEFKKIVERKLRSSKEFKLENG